MTIEKLKGVETILTKSEAVIRYHLMPNRIGDLIVLGDRNTVFGDLDTESENLPDSYRSHGSVYEAEVPIFLFHANNAPSEKYFTHNYKVASWLYR